MVLKIFKKKKREKEKEVKEEKKEEVKEVIKQRKQEKKKESKKGKETEEVSEFPSLILKQPHITEKATNLAKNNQYVFEIFPSVNKTQVKKAVEELFGVEVLKVRIINVPPKKRRLGMIEGEKKGFKKAIVKIKEGQKIEILPK